MNTNRHNLWTKIWVGPAHMAPLHCALVAPQKWFGHKKTAMRNVIPLDKINHINGNPVSGNPASGGYFSGPIVP